MATETKTDNCEIRRGRTEIDFPNTDGGITTAVYPLVGPNNYQGLFNEINNTNGLRLPTGKDHVDLLHAVYFGDEAFKNSPEAEDVRSKMKHNWFYVPQVNIWTPESFGERNGVYVVLNREGKGRNQEVNLENLDNILENGTEVMKGVIMADGVSFAHRDTYNDQSHTPKELAENGFVIASYGGLERAQRLAEVSETFKENPYVWIVENPNEPVQRVSALGCYDNRLYVYGYIIEDNYRVFSFGVKE